ncbi:hypothetical protein N7478_008495 [Penicillium angulare]|uniref:uncharacterized protein n=1 Tax=Penicillium angulare TaxID=116970 RepID=UPI002540039B|nr:uncharacterized protein N7478_008495 [Penicillium angulare]KAJ5273370.1 hypothetical protein N7478_008495 [Penicillium angulare]
MASNPSVFFVGAGYIGLNVLDQLLDAKYRVTVLTRRTEQASELEKRGVNPIIGSLSDLDLLTTQAAKHPIIINTASCEDLPSVLAILAGVRQRVSENLPATYLHTSGTGILEDGAGGMYKGDRIYGDATREDIDSIPASSMHRHVDIPINEAAQEFGDRAKIAVIIPPFVYGYNSAHKRHSMANPAFTRFALKHGFSGHVGEGRNIWSVVHVKDLARAFLTVLKYVETVSPAVLLENLWFFAENGSEVAMIECAKHIGEALFDAGKIQSSAVRSFTESECVDVFGPFTKRGLGCNSRSRAERLRALGWEATEKDVWTSLREDEIPGLLAELEVTSS